MKWTHKFLPPFPRSKIRSHYQAWFLTHTCRNFLKFSWSDNYLKSDCSFTCSSSEVTLFNLSKSSAAVWVWCWQFRKRQCSKGIGPRGWGNESWWPSELWLWFSFCFCSTILMNNSATLQRSEICGYQLKSWCSVVDN
jgi:hypothetical protein